MNIHSWCLIPLLLVSSGCATRGYVQNQIDPVTCKVDIVVTKTTSLEERANTLESRVGALENLVNQAQLANKAMLDDATAKAMESAQRAEASATAAGLAAQRTEKMFELGQKK